MSTESKDETCVIDFVTGGKHPPHQPQPGVSINHNVLDQKDELRARIKDLAVRVEEVGDNNHYPFTQEIKEELLPHGFKMP